MKTSLLTAAVLSLFPAAALAAPRVTLSIGEPALRPQGAAGVAFCIFGALAVIGAVLTITRRNPVVAAVSLVGTLLSLAGVFLVLQASFMAVIQVLVYAGAIMVLFVLVVMSVEHPEHEELGFLRAPLVKVVGLVAAIWLGFRMALVLMGGGISTIAAVSADWGTVGYVAKVLFSDYLFPFEAISLLLLCAVVGAVVVTRRRTAAAAKVEDQPETGRVA